MPSASFCNILKAPLNKAGLLIYKQGGIMKAFSRWINENHAFSQAEDSPETLARQIKMFLSDRNVKTKAQQNKVLVTNGMVSLIIDSFMDSNGSYSYHIYSNQKLLNVFNSENKMEMLKYIKAKFSEEIGQ
jgi:hypothetical protein